MITRIDIIENANDEVVIRHWLQAMEDHADARSGFVGAELLRVYKAINRDGYSFVSFARWESLAAYNRSAVVSRIAPLLSRSQAGPALYGRIDQSAHSNLPPDRGQLVITNPYRIDKQHVAENVAMWNATKDMMEKQDGFIDAALYHSFDSVADEYVLVSRARWASEAHFMTPFGDKNYKELVAPFEGVFKICFSNVIHHIVGVASRDARRSPDF